MSKENSNLDKQKAPLKAELEAQLLEANKKNKKLEAKLLEFENSQSPSEKEDEDVVEAERELKADEYIDVVSLCNFKLNLSTEGFGKGKRYAFRKFGEKKRILYQDLISIIESQMSFLESGYFYILDSRVIRRHGFDDMYDNILSKERFDEVLACNQETSVELYKVANEKQRKMIDRTIIHKIVEGENIDLNVVSLLSNISGIDIRKMAEDAKVTKRLMENKE